MASAQEMFDLSGKVAVLTGVGSGIGKASAADAGRRRRDDRRRRHRRGRGARRPPTRSRPPAAPPSCSAPTSRSAPTSTRSSTAPRPSIGRVDIVGNIAGVPHNKMVADCTDEEFERILAINLKSVFYGCQAAIRHMVPQGSGCIVNISSGAIDTPAPTLACYGMTKAAVAMLTKTLATEVGRHGIRVNAIAPGMILTNFSRHNFVDADGNVVPEKLEQYHKRASAMAPLGRAGEAQDVAQLVPLPRLRRGELRHRPDRAPQRRRLDALVSDGSGFGPCSSAGRRTSKHAPPEPVPSVMRTVPPCVSTMRLTNARPRPGLPLPQGTRGRLAAARSLRRRRRAAPRRRREQLLRAVRAPSCSPSSSPTATVRSTTTRGATWAEAGTPEARRGVRAAPSGRAEPVERGQGPQLGAAAPRASSPRSPTSTSRATASATPPGSSAGVPTASRRRAPTSSSTCRCRWSCRRSSGFEAREAAMA